MPADLINLIYRTLNENSFVVWVVLVALFIFLYWFFRPKPPPKVRQDSVDGVKLYVCPHCCEVIAIHYEGILVADPHDEKDCPLCGKGVER